MHRKVRIGWWRWRCSCGARSWERCPDRLRQLSLARLALLDTLKKAPMEMTW